MNSQSTFVAGVVLHQRPYRETSVLVDLLTRDLGKVSAVCRGVRSGKSAKGNEKRSLLQPFQPLQLVLMGRHELKTLGNIEADGRRFMLSGKNLFCAMYMNELLNRVLPKEVSFPEVYDLYLASLLRLSEVQSIEPVLREFELSLLDLLGYGFSWQREWNTDQPIQQQHFYTFVNEQGFQQCAANENSRNCFAGIDLLNAARQQWDDKSLSAAKWVLRMAMRAIVGEKPLKSRELFRKMEQKNE